MRVYWTNESYPEMRPLTKRWARHRVWWRAFYLVRTDWRIYVFLLAVGVILLGFDWLDARLQQSLQLDVKQTLLLHTGMAVLAVLAGGMLFLTWGGHIMRLHLRRAGPLCAECCPNCGYLVSGQLQAPGGGNGQLRCPECGGVYQAREFGELKRVPRRCG
jgi:hypothetical protein